MSGVTPLHDRAAKALDYAQESVKQMLALSTGVVALTLTFFKDFAGAASAAARDVIFVSWILFFISILFGILTLLSMTSNIWPRKPAERADAAPDIWTTDLRNFCRPSNCLLYSGIYHDGGCPVTRTWEPCRDIAYSYASASLGWRDSPAPGQGAIIARRHTPFLEMAPLLARFARPAACQTRRRYWWDRTSCRMERSEAVTMTRSRRDGMIAACGARPGAVEDYPFGDDTAVFKVGGKMFALVSLGPAPGDISLKCDPDIAVGLRGRYPAITAGYHLSKRHWNTIQLDGSVPDDELLELIDHSYELVVAGLTRAERNKLST